jgi:hypothetical protein
MYTLTFRCNLYKTLVLIINFNYAEHLIEKTEERHEQNIQTIGYTFHSINNKLLIDFIHFQNTPGFLPCTVELNSSLSLSSSKIFIASLILNVSNGYQFKHPNQLTLFLPSKYKFYFMSTSNAPSW